MGAMGVSFVYYMKMRICNKYHKNVTKDVQFRFVKNRNTVVNIGTISSYLFQQSDYQYNIIIFLVC